MVVKPQTCLPHIVEDFIIIKDDSQNIPPSMEDFSRHDGQALNMVAPNMEDFIIIKDDCQN